MRQSVHALALAGFLAASSWFTQPVFLDQFWGLLTSWGESSLDEGCGMDPSGSCKPASQPRSDAGCIMDPNGHCRQDPQTEAGCGMDPNGCPQGS